MAPVAGETVAEGAACREIALVEQVRCVDRGRPSVPVERHQRVNKGVTGCLEHRCWSRRDCVADIANASADAQGHVLLEGNRLDAPGRGHVLRYVTHPLANRSEEHTSELQSLLRISYAVFCLKKTNQLLRANHN